jgi:predicted MFS family arabinose efflux permease
MPLCLEGAHTHGHSKSWATAHTVDTCGRCDGNHRFTRRIINAAIAVAAVNFALLPWTLASLATAVPALVVWGVCGWGFLVPQQHRLISITPAAAPLLMGLNSAAVHVGVSMSGLIGGARQHGPRGTLRAPVLAG